MQIVDKTMSDLFSNSYSSAIITLFLVLYGGLAAPKFPSFVADLFENAFFRIIVLSLIVYKGNRDPSMALMIAVGFTVTLNMINKKDFVEKMSSTESCEAAEHLAQNLSNQSVSHEYVCNKNINNYDQDNDNWNKYICGLHQAEGTCRPDCCQYQHPVEIWCPEPVGQCMPKERGCSQG